MPCSTQQYDDPLRLYLLLQCGVHDCSNALFHQRCQDERLTSVACSSSTTELLQSDSTSRAITTDCETPKIIFGVLLDLRLASKGGCGWKADRCCAIEESLAKSAPSRQAHLYCPSHRGKGLINPCSGAKNKLCRLVRAIGRCITVVSSFMCIYGPATIHLGVPILLTVHHDWRNST